MILLPNSKYEIRLLKLRAVIEEIPKSRYNTKEAYVVSKNVSNTLLNCSGYWYSSSGGATVGTQFRNRFQIDYSELLKWLL